MGGGVIGAGRPGWYSGRSGLRVSGIAVGGELVSMDDCSKNRFSEPIN